VRSRALARFAPSAATLYPLLLCACGGGVGTVDVGLTTAPGSHVLDAVETLRLTITNPHQVTTAQKTASGGFDIVIDQPANGALGALVIEGLDASGATVAVGQSPPFPFGGIDAKVVIYMAAPNSVGLAPGTLTPARTGLAVAPLSYGALFAGGTDASGASNQVAIYNAFDHTLTGGLALPAPRSGLALGVGANNIAFMFGGTDASGNPTGTAWAFNTNATPNGSYTDFGDKSGFARAAQLAVPIGNDHFLITGMPAAELDGEDGSMTARTEVASLPAAGASVVGTDGVLAAVFAGDTGIVRYRNGAFDTIDATPRTGAAVVALPGGKLAVVCGGPTLMVDPVAGTSAAFGNHPETGCAAAATSRHLLIASGSAVEIDDATTLAPVATATLSVPRTGATAVALPNDQVMIVGGTDGSGAPIDAIELFTPAAP
jgi:hypothetical protein